MKEVIEQAKSNFLHSKNALLKSLATTPDDRLNWSPSPTARTPIHQAAHAASSMNALLETFQGRTFAVPTTEEAERGFREWEKQFSTREEVLDLIETHSNAYVAWLDALTEEQLASEVKLPFGMGYAPMTMALTFIPSHTSWHTAQLDYIQTIYGDLDWHVGGK